MDVTSYLNTYRMTPRQLAETIVKDVFDETGITATAGIGTNMYLCKIAMDIVAKHTEPDENGVRMAELDEMTYRKAGVKAYNGILKQFIRVNADKTISLTRCCEVSGLGPGPGPYVKEPNYRRDGSFDYYMSEPIRDNDGKGVGPFIWASLEMEMLK